MACSDNVVRAGLTPKFKDVDNLVSMLTYSMGGPTINAGTLAVTGNISSSATTVTSASVGASCGSDGLQACLWPDSPGDDRAAQCLVCGP